MREKVFKQVGPLFVHRYTVNYVFNRQVIFIIKK